MRFYRCKCGKTEAWGSMQPYACKGCPDCNTSLETNSAVHKTPLPHEFTGARRQVTEDGPIDVTVCKHCHLTKWEIEERELLDKKGV